MKIAVIGGKTILDVIFLKHLSEIEEDYDVSCYGDSGEISYGEKVLKIKNIINFDTSLYDVVINLSKDFKEYHNQIKSCDCLYLNYFEEFNENCLLLPDFACIPLEYFFDSISGKILDLDITNIKSIGELGKEELHRFHREIQDSHFNVVTESKGKNPLAFSLNIDCLEGSTEFNDLNCEKNISKFIKDAISVESLVSALVAPVNKASMLIINFTLKKEIELAELKKSFEKKGFVTSFHSTPSIMIENDCQIYLSKMKKSGNKYSVALTYDALYVFANWLIAKIQNV